MKNKQPERIAIFGGAFDPPTFGHLSIANYLIQRMGFDEVWLMPAYRHTFPKNMTEFQHRFNMCKLLVNDERIKVSDYQYIHDLDSSTLNLFIVLRKEFRKKKEFFMVIGSDNANVIHKWINYEQLLEKVPFIVFERKGQELKEDTIWCLFEPHIFVKHLKQEKEFSSTIVREAIKKEEPIKKYVPKNIIKYIKKNKLYV